MAYHQSGIITIIEIRSFRSFYTVLPCILSISSWSLQSTRSLQFPPFTVTIFGQNIPLITPIFLKRSIIFPLMLFSSSFIHCSLKNAFLSLYTVLWNLRLIGYTFLFLPCFIHIYPYCQSSYIWMDFYLKLMFRRLLQKIIPNRVLS